MFMEFEIQIQDYDGNVHNLYVCNIMHIEAADMQMKKRRSGGGGGEGLLPQPPMYNRT